MEGIRGKHFSVTDPNGVNTIIYRVNKTDKNFLKVYPKYTVERLVFAEELRGEMKKKTFFIDEPAYEEQLLILSFAKDKVVVNMGILEDDRVRISKKPAPIKFDTLYAEERGMYKEFNYTPNLGRPISIIDPDTTEEIRPKVYLDKETNELKGKCELKPYKSYFAFEIRENKKDENPNKINIAGLSFDYKK